VTGDLWVGVATAGWTGILTAISPCPLATNIAAISFIGRKVSSPRATLITGLLYALGRSLVYVALAAALVTTALSAPVVSQALQKYMSKLLGPMLILVGMVLLNLIEFQGRGSDLGERVGRRMEGWGPWAGLVMGVVFALSFCPASAALYFTGLIPLALRLESNLLLPLVFGIGTALPVVAFAFLIAAGARSMAAAFNRITAFETWARLITGIIFVGVGIYFCLAFIYQVV
jgi:cytochrome c biogenesis protein CcdA